MSGVLGRGSQKPYRSQRHGLCVLRQALCIFYSALVFLPWKASLSVHKAPHLKSREVTFQCGEEHHFGHRIIYSFVAHLLTPYYVASTEISRWQRQGPPAAHGQQLERESGTMSASWLSSQAQAQSLAGARCASVHWPGGRLCYSWPICHCCPQGPCGSGVALESSLACLSQGHLSGGFQHLSVPSVKEPPHFPPDN